MENDDKIYSMEDGAKRLGISKQGLYRLTSQRKIEFYRPSPGRIIFSEEQLKRYLSLHIQPVG